MADELISEWRPQVFINFRGADLRDGFISHLTTALKENKINYYIDCEEPRGASLEILIERIKESQIALVFFSALYAESDWCLDELVEIMKNMEKGSLRVIPIFFKVKPEDVKGQKKEFGVALYGEGRRKRPKMTQWEDALEAVPTRMGLVLPDQSSENDFLRKLVDSVKEVEAIILKESRGGSSSSEPIRNLMGTSSSSLPPYEEQRLEQLEERFGFDDKVTQIFGIVGMAGIGKTILAQKHFNKWGKRLAAKKMILGIHKMKKDYSWLKEELEAEIFQDKCFILLDDVSGKSQIQYLLSNLHRIKKGSKIVITTRDKSCIKGIVRDRDTYVVPGLNDNEALLLFSYHAFGNQAYTPTQKGLSKRFVDYAGGNPRALEELGKELCGKDDAHWEKRIETLSHPCNVNIKRELRISYDKLTDQQKDAFLDIACFFPSENEDCVTSLLASKDSGAEAARVVGDLADKFMISVSAGQIEMPQILCSLGKELGLLASVEDNMEKSRLWDHDTVVKTLVNKKEADSTVRGILLDVSKLEEEFSIASNKLTLMPNLRYLKIFDSSCPRQCKVVVEAVECKVHLPDELYLPLEKIGYLHWLKLPLTELPSDFNPENLVDLRLPYSMIERVWGGKKDTPNLKWVDLSHSTKLTDLSALCKAESLEILNLEGCTELVDLPKETENMKSLSFLNLRGCTSLSSLPEMKNLVRLKTLILSGCSRFNDFHVKSENLEHLHLDGTEIVNLPQTIQELQRLIVLNLKDCKMLSTLPDCLGKLKALEELILSGCSKLRIFPEIKENMENLQILLLDRTEITDVPKILLRCVNPVDQVNKVQPRTGGLSLLRHLCLSRNEKITSLQSSISEFYHLKWIDLKYCKRLQSVSMLPPNLQCLDAHDCTSLKTVASPLARPTATEQVPSSFIFTNCDKLEHIVKSKITCYGHDKGRILSKTLNRHNKGLSFETLVSICFPGSEVPAWFGHKASGAVLKPELPQHWSDSGLVGIALCAIVAFEEHYIGNNNLHVKCIFDFNNVKTSFSYFNFPVGALSETSDEQRTITSTHVFIGYTNWLNIKKCQEEDGKESCAPKTKKDGKEGCVTTTNASIEFQVTNDFGVVKNCEVLKCGFSLVYETGSWEASSMTDGVEQGELESHERVRGFRKL